MHRHKSEAAKKMHGSSTVSEETVRKFVRVSEGRRFVHNSNVGSLNNLRWNLSTTVQ